MPSATQLQKKLGLKFKNHALKKQQAWFVEISVMVKYIKRKHDVKINFTRTAAYYNGHQSQNDETNAITRKTVGNAEAGFQYGSLLLYDRDI